MAVRHIDGMFFGQGNIPAAPQPSKDKRPVTTKSSVFARLSQGVTVKEDDDMASVLTKIVRMQAPPQGNKRVHNQFSTKSPAKLRSSQGERLLTVCHACGSRVMSENAQKHMLGPKHSTRTRKRSRGPPPHQFLAGTASSAIMPQTLPGAKKPERTTCKSSSPEFNSISRQIERLKIGTRSSKENVGQAQRGQGRTSMLQRRDGKHMSTDVGSHNLFRCSPPFSSSVQATTFTAGPPLMWKHHRQGSSYTMPAEKFGWDGLERKLEDLKIHTHVQINEHPIVEQQRAAYNYTVYQHSPIPWMMGNHGFIHCSDTTRLQAPMLQHPDGVAYGTGTSNVPSQGPPSLLTLTLTAAPLVATPWMTSPVGEWRNLNHRDSRGRL